MHKKWLYIIPVLLLTTAIYFFVFSWLIPKTAMLTIPAIWNRIPLQQSKLIVHDYLGAPALKDSSIKGVTEEWHMGSKDKMYILKINYGTDTAAIGYSIYYAFSNKIISHKYLLEDVSTR